MKKTRKYSFRWWLDKAGKRNDPHASKEVSKIMKNLECGPLVRKFYLNTAYKQKIFLERLEELNDMEKLLKMADRGFPHRLRLRELRRKHPIEYYQLERALIEAGELQESGKSHLWHLFFGVREL